MKQIIDKIVSSPEFHEIYVRGYNYRTLACCGKEILTVVCSKKDESLFHYIHTENGFSFSVNSPGLFEAESLEVLRKVAINNPEIDGDTLTAISWDISAEHLIEDCERHVCLETKIVFEYKDDVRVVSSDGLEMDVNDKPRKRDQLRDLQPVQYDLVHAMIY